MGIDYPLTDALTKPENWVISCIAMFETVVQ